MIIVAIYDPYFNIVYDSGAWAFCDADIKEPIWYWIRRNQGTIQEIHPKIHHPKEGQS